MGKYWVVGGEYADTRFTEMRGEIEVYGPFATYQEAEAEWSRQAWKTVDNAHFRYTVTDREPNTTTRYWVIGGEYADTRFSELKGAEERYGPFATYQEAETEWSRHAWKTVDNAHFRYTVVSETVRA